VVIAELGVSAFTAATAVPAFIVATAATAVSAFIEAMATEVTGVPASTDTGDTAGTVGAALACIVTAAAGETVDAPA
jgi:hypothetical protein